MEMVAWAPAAAASASAERAAPAGAPLGDAQRVESARLMRINHSGEVAAQALYQGHRVEEITRSDAGAKNLSQTAACLSEIIEDALDNIA
jgi:demethoxyubiquinone hydroxylase (CLK1/Coq7/Cat5 family)